MDKYVKSALYQKIDGNNIFFSFVIMESNVMMIVYLVLQEQFKSAQYLMGIYEQLA